MLKLLLGRAPKGSDSGSKSLRALSATIPHASIQGKVDILVNSDCRIRSLPQTIRNTDII